VLIVGNWKMHKGPEEAAGFCRELRDQLEWVDGVDVAVCPPFPSLSAAANSDSNRLTFGPLVNHPDRSVAATSLTSAS